MRTRATPAGTSMVNIVVAISLLASLHPGACNSLTTDALALLALKSAIVSDPTRVLSNWVDSDGDPCHWHGVVCSPSRQLRRVSSLVLQGKCLSGYIPSELGLLDALTRLSLSNNSFVGPIPRQIMALKALVHLDLSSNSLNGSLPPSLPRLRNLVGTMNLSYNAFTGEIPSSYGNFPARVSLDLSHNNLSGSVPMVGTLAIQGPTAFTGNPGLCGFPLQTQCPIAVSVPVDSSGAINPLDSSRHSSPDSVGNEKRKKERTIVIIVALILAVFLAIAAAIISLWLVRRNRVSAKRDNERGVDLVSMEQHDCGAKGGVEMQEGKFVVLDEGFSLELEDLLRASAYVVGKSRGGIVYKVVAGGGKGATPTVVAVRRLNDGDATWKLKEFESEVEAIRRVQHPNIVPLKAYYYAADEKLLVSDYIRNGSLWNSLHGGSSSTAASLSWATRLNIAQGSAKGLMHIHEHGSRKYFHGNLKSTKILLDDDMHPRVAGFGVTRLVSDCSPDLPSSSKKQCLSQSWKFTSTPVPPMGTIGDGYVAPEARSPGAKCTQKSDVYSFGILLMELVSGRVPDAVPENGGRGLEEVVRDLFREEGPLSEIIDPSLLTEVHAKRQVTAVYHVALDCTVPEPEHRPNMRTVTERLDRIKDDNF